MLNSEFTEGTNVASIPLHPFVVELWGSRNAPAFLPPQPHTFLQPAVGSASLTLRSLFCPNTVIGVEPLPRDPEECELKVRGVSFNFQRVDSFNTQEQNERKESHIAQVHSFQIWQELPQVWHAWLTACDWQHSLPFRCRGNSVGWKKKKKNQKLWQTVCEEWHDGRCRRWEHCHLSGTIPDIPVSSDLSGDKHANICSLAPLTCSRKWRLGHFKEVYHLFFRISDTAADIWHFFSPSNHEERISP